MLSRARIGPICSFTAAGVVKRITERKPNKGSRPDKACVILWGIKLPIFLLRY